MCAVGSVLLLSLIFFDGWVLLLISILLFTRFLFLFSLPQEGAWRGPQVKVAGSHSKKYLSQNFTIELTSRLPPTAVFIC